MKLPEDAVLDWLQGILGPYDLVGYVAHDHGYSQLWRIATASDYVWLKMHRFPHKWAGEVHALTRWPSPLMPGLIAHRTEPNAVLLSEVPGSPAEELNLTPDAEARLWQNAGAWLRRFHERQNSWIGEVLPDGSPGLRSTQDPTKLIREGFENRLRAGRDQDVLNEAQYRFARQQFDAGLPAFAGEGARSIHRDFHPRNWLAHGDGTLSGVIDFEHARWDVRAFDLNRPWDKEFSRNPSLSDSFFEAYGRPDPRFMVQIQTMRLYNAVTGLVWGLEVGETAFSEFNRAALERMMANPPSVLGQRDLPTSVV